MDCCIFLPTSVVEYVLSASVPFRNYHCDCNTCNDTTGNFLYIRRERRIVWEWKTSRRGLCQTLLCPDQDT